MIPSNFSWLGISWLDLLTWMLLRADPHLKSSHSTAPMQSRRLLWPYWLTPNLRALRRTRNTSRINGRQSLTCSRTSLTSMYRWMSSSKFHRNYNRDSTRSLLQTRPFHTWLTSRVCNRKLNEVTRLRFQFFTVGLVDEEPTTNKHYYGVCSSYLNGLKTGDKAWVFVQDTKSTFRVPNDPNTTMIMICAGTGLAPFRGFLQERKQSKAAQGQVGKSILFFGCRRPEHDYIYNDELSQLKSEGVLTDAFVAFSRKVPTKKEYVQDKLLEQKELVWELIKDSDPKKCVVYVCGSARGMAKDVRDTFEKIAQDYLPEQIAQRFVAALQEKGAYLEDVWGWELSYFRIDTRCSDYNCLLIRLRSWVAIRIKK